MRKIYIIIPVYNNAPTLNELTEGIRQSIAGWNPDDEFVLLYVNDASTDESGEIISNLSSDHQLTITSIKLPSNTGQVNTIMAGLEMVEDNAISIILAADLQDPPRLIVELLEAYTPDCDMVIAARKSYYTISSALFHRMISIFYKDYPKGGFDVVLVNDRVRKSLFDWKPRPQLMQIEMLQAAKQTEVIYYEKLPRLKGRSQWSFAKRMSYATSFLYYYTPVKYILLVALAIGFAFLLYRWS